MEGVRANPTGCFYFGGLLFCIQMKAAAGHLGSAESGIVVSI